METESNEQKFLRRLSAITSGAQLIAMSAQSTKVLTHDFEENYVLRIICLSNTAADQLLILDAIKKAFDQIHIYKYDVNLPQYDKEVPGYFEQYRLDLELGIAFTHEDIATLTAAATPQPDEQHSTEQMAKADAMVLERIISQYLNMSEQKRIAKKEHIKTVIFEMVDSSRIELSEGMKSRLNTFDDETPARITKAEIVKVSATEAEDNGTDGSQTKDDKIFLALNAVINDGLIVHAYDYHIVKWVLREKFNVTFSNGQSFVDYLVAHKVTHKVPTADNINKKTTDMNGKFPDYTWTNTDQNEVVRRINIAKSFMREMTKLK